MKNKIEHTPTPWTFNGYKVVDAHGNSVETKENREFIVRAVNSYKSNIEEIDELKQAVLEARETNRRLRSSHEMLLNTVKEAFNLLNRGISNIGPMNSTAILNYLGRAITQAEGK